MVSQSKLRISAEVSNNTRQTFLEDKKNAGALG
jgi:hypothetical protein